MVSETGGCKRCSRRGILLSKLSAVGASKLHWDYSGGDDGVVHSALARVANPLAGICSPFITGHLVVHQGVKKSLRHARD